MATDETRTYYHCGCNDETEHPTVRHPPIHAYLASVEEELGEDGEKEEKPFDPKAPLSAFSLSPLQNLLFCEECQQIRCDRCTLQEIVTYYCPHCLYETPTSLVKGEGTRLVETIRIAPRARSTIEGTNHGLIWIRADE